MFTFFNSCLHVLKLCSKLENMTDYSRMKKEDLIQALKAANEKTETSLVSFTTRIPETLRNKIKATSFATGLSVQEVVTAALESYLNEDKD